MKSTLAFSGQHLQNLTYNMLSINNHQIIMQRVMYGNHDFADDISQEAKSNIIKSLAKYLDFNLDKNTINSILSRNYLVKDPNVLIVINYIHTVEMIYQYSSCNLSMMNLVIGFQQQISSFEPEQDSRNIENIRQYNSMQRKLHDTYQHKSKQKNHKIKNIFNIHSILSQYYNIQQPFKYRALCLILLLRSLLVQNNYEFTHLINLEENIESIIKTLNQGKTGTESAQLSQEEEFNNLPNVNILLKQIIFAYQQSIDNIKNFSDMIKDYQQKIKASIQKLYKRFTIMDIYLTHKEIKPHIIDQIIMQELQNGSLHSEIVNNSIQYFQINKQRHFNWGQKLKKVKDIILRQRSVFNFQDLISLCPNVSAVSIRKVLANCSELGLITCVQKGRYAQWERNKNGTKRAGA